MPHMNAPTLELIAVEPVTGEIVYHGETGIGYRVTKENNSLNLFRGDLRIGKLLFGSEKGGSIWVITKEINYVIGQYFAEGSYYLVSPIGDGLLQPEKKEKIHPLDYLVRYFENQF